VNSKNIYIGLIPVGTPAPQVRTSGLKWNLGGREEPSSLSFGSLVSTSNALAEENGEVQVFSKGAPLLFTLDWGDQGCEALDNQLAQKKQCQK